MKKAFIIILTCVTALILLSLSYLYLSQPHIIDTGIARLSRTFADHKAQVWAVRFSPDGKLIASGSVDSTVIIRDKASGKIMTVLKQPKGITNIDFSPHGQYLVTSSYDAKARLWDVSNGRLLKTLMGNTGTLWTVAYSPDGKTIAGAGEDKDIVLWDVATAKIIRRFTGHKRNIWSVKFSTDGTMLASASFDTDVKLWNVADGALIRTLTGHTEAVVDLAFSHDGKTLATTSDDKTIKIWNVMSGAVIKTFKVDEHVQAVAFSPDDTRLMTGGRDKTMIGEFIQNFTGDSKRFRGVSGRLWDIERGVILQTFTSHKNDINDVAYSNDGLWIATASEDKTVELWQITK